MCSGDDPLSIAVTLISFGAILYCFRTTRWFLLHKRVGPVIICFLCVLKDVIYVFLVWVVVYLSFALGIWLLYKLLQAFGKCDTEWIIKRCRGCSPRCSGSSMKGTALTRGSNTSLL